MEGINRKKVISHICVVCVASDGESRRRAALVEEYTKTELPSHSPTRAKVDGFRFMDYITGEDKIIINNDYNHVFKCIQNRVLRIEDICVEGTWITPSTIQRHLLDSESSKSHVHTMFNPSDHQDVPTAYNLLLDPWSLPPASPTDTREAIRTYSKLCYHLVAPYTHVDLSLSEQLEHLSTAAHL